MRKVKEDYFQAMVLGLICNKIYGQEKEYNEIVNEFRKSIENGDIFEPETTPNGAVGK